MAEFTLLKLRWILRESFGNQDCNGGDLGQWKGSWEMEGILDGERESF